VCGFTSFLCSWFWWRRISRRFEFPFVFVAVLVAAALLWSAPRRFGQRVMPFGWAGEIATGLGSALASIPLARVFAPTEASWKVTLSESELLGAWYNQAP